MQPMFIKLCIFNLDFIAKYLITLTVLDRKRKAIESENETLSNHHVSYILLPGPEILGD